MPEKLTDLSGLPNLRRAMKQHGYDEKIIKKICHENWLRVLQKTWGCVIGIIKMVKQERAAFISKRLNEIYPETPVPLNHRDAYQLLVAVLLSAQCTDARVNIVTPGLFAKASNAQDMAVLEEDEILEAIKSCGLAPKKSRAIKRLSEILVENYNGEVPNDYASLEALPGVGHKTASVVMSQWFGFPAFPVDTPVSYTHLTLPTKRIV